MTKKKQRQGTEFWYTKPFCDILKLTNISNAVKRNAHSNLKLCGGKIDPRDHLSRRRLYSKMWVQLQKIKVVLSMAKKIYSV
jgi:hypothetical protein